MAEKNFLGTGMKFPPQVNPATGRFITVSETQSVRESIYLILMTQKSERMVRPEFGSTIMEYAFMDMSETMLTILARDIQTDILTQEPRVSEVEIHMEPMADKGCLMVNISYTVTAQNKKDNMVFPFYLNETAEGDEDEEIERIQTI